MKGVVVTLALFTAVASPAQADTKALAESKQCFSCHAMDQESKAAPSFKSIAARYKGKTNVQVGLARKVRIGGSGHWGATAMPGAGPRPEVSEREADELVSWILAQR